MSTYVVIDGDISQIPLKYHTLVLERIEEIGKVPKIVIDIVDDKVTVFEYGKCYLNFVEPYDYSLPPLVGMDKKGKLRIWKIWTLNNTVYKSYGEFGGLLITNTRSYQGVNQKNKNRTTGDEQAKREAERDWIKQLDKQYVPIDDAGKKMAEDIKKEKLSQGGTNVNIASTIRGQKKTSKTKVDNFTIPDFDSKIFPMHCHAWSQEPKVLKYFNFDDGVYIQPKLDGIRCLAQNTPSGVVLLTKSGKQQVWLSHIRKELSSIFSIYPNIILDGEMYAETIRGIAEKKGKKYTYRPSEMNELNDEQRFDVISGAVRPVRNEPHPLEQELSYYIFDIADQTKDQDERFKILKTIFNNPAVKKCSHLKMVPTRSITFIEDITEIHDEYAQEGYEGVVLRARDLMYESGKRSMKMRKYKYFIDEEMAIVDLTCDPGVPNEQFTWVCEKVVGGEVKNVSVKPRGTKAMKLNWYENKDEYIGKLLTVKYQRSSANGIPLFPVGKAIRDYD